MEKFSVKDYKNACKEYKEKFVALDNVLYDLAKKYPRHKCYAEIHAKLWVFGRTYATGIERQISTKHSKGFQGKSMTLLAEHFWKNRQDIEATLAMLHGVEEPLDSEKLKVISETHGQLLRIVQRKCRNGMSPRSFVSKYLHFHCPAVPIYDSVAVSRLRKKYSGERQPKTPNLPGADQRYGDFVLRFLQFYQDVHRSGQKVSVKLLDNYLLAPA